MGDFNADVGKKLNNEGRGIVGNFGLGALGLGDRNERGNRQWQHLYTVLSRLITMAVEEFTRKTLDLLEEERDAEIEETQILTQRLSARELERKGVCVLKMQLKSRRSGLYGRMLAVFEPSTKSRDKNAKPELPSNNITPGDIVGVGLMKSEQTDKPLVTGIVTQVTSFNISVACDDSQDIFDLDEDDLFKLTKLANDVTYRRLKATLNELSKYRRGPSQRLIDVFFCQAEVSKPSGDFSMTFVNEGLDWSQREAVRFSLCQREVAIIHGPPGTGKTTTVVELIVQAVRQGLKILATAPSNIAVDNLVERLAENKQRIVRVGHPARLLSHLQKYSLDAIVSASEEKGIARDVRSDLQKIMSKMKKTRSHGERRALRAEMKFLRREATQREEAATKEVLSRADVVLVTLTSASNDGPLKHLAQDHFNLVVIDECSQALEVACWIGLLRAPRCVLAGDHMQLPPTILSKKAATGGLALTLMERVLNLLSEEKGHDVVRMLTTQYRMHHDIMAWAAHQLYQDKLTAHESVAGHLLSDLEGVTSCEESSFPLVLIDTAGCELHELDLPEEVSKGNEGEADIVAAHVEQLINMGVRPVDIAVISPYNLQVDLLRVRLSSKYPNLEVKSVDGFQGREKEAIVISMVRSNDTGEVGFLADKRRINVAVTRARRHLCVVCDSDTVCHDAFIKSLVSYMTVKGEVWSAHQYIQEGKVSEAVSRPTRLVDMMVKQTENSQKVNKGKAGRSSTQSTVPKNPLQTKEEKAGVYRDQLNKFVSDPSQLTFAFPATLNSHDRMVIHEVAEKLGLYHCSTGEEGERHIQVSKVADGPQHRTSNVTLPQPGMSTDRHSEFESKTSVTIVDNGQEESVELSGNTAPLQQTSVPLTVDLMSSSHDVKVWSSCEALTSDNTSLSTTIQLGPAPTSNIESVPCDSFGDNNAVSPSNANISVDVNKIDFQSDIMVAEAKMSLSNKSPHCIQENGASNQMSLSDTSVCQWCEKEIVTANFSLHELHCSRQHRGLRRDTAAKPLTQQVGNKTRDLRGQLGSAKSVYETRDVRPKETKKSKLKTTPKVSHVEEASIVLGNIAPDDFDGLIASITRLDNMCAFKKCKTLTNTLGRNCTFCTRRFCLTHLMPEIHGCGGAAKDAARRIISREGVLYRGSGVPSKKPNDTRRAQLEHRMDKRLGDLAEKRSRNTGNKKS